MPTRILRDGILTSERVDLLNWQEEVFYRRLQSVVDDHGRFYANPKLILAACFPLRIGKVSDSDIGKWITSCVTAGLVRVYPASDGKRYIEVMDFGQRVQSKSKFPAFNGDSRNSTVENGESPEVTVENGLGEGVVEVEAGDGMRDSAAAVLDAYHQLLPGCKHISVLNPKRRKRIAEAVKLAKSVCKSQGWPYDADGFWIAYFGECAKDPWMRGDKPNPNNPAWKQHLDVLIAEDRFAGVMDSAIASMRSRT